MARIYIPVLERLSKRDGALEMDWRQLYIKIIDWSKKLNWSNSSRYLESYKPWKSKKVAHSVAYRNALRSGKGSGLLDHCESYLPKWRS